MKHRAALALIASAAALAASGAAFAQAAVAASTAASGPAPMWPVDDRADRREPVVLHNLFEDGGSRIDELVVRGEVQHVVVTPKVGTSKSYEIIVQRGGRTPPDSTGGASSAVGKRVWNVLAF